MRVLSALLAHCVALFLLLCLYTLAWFNLWSRVEIIHQHAIYAPGLRALLVFWIPEGLSLLAGVATFQLIIRRLTKTTLQRSAAVVVLTVISIGLPVAMPIVVFYGGCFLLRACI